MPLTVHRLESDLKKYGMLFPPATADSNWLLRPGGQAMKDGWKVPRAWIVDDDPRISQDIADITDIGGVPVLSAHAIDILGDVFGQYGEFLPLETNTGQDMFAYNVLNVVDCLDRKNTKGFWLDQNRLGEADAFAFLPDRVKGAGIFKVPEMLGAPVFLTSDVLQLIRQSNLSGFACPQVWRAP